MGKVLITGITGQDGSFLAEQLIAQGHDVYGIIRRTSTANRQRIDHISHDPNMGSHLHLRYGDITDSSCLCRLFKEIQPERCYHLCAQSHVGISFQVPEYSSRVDGLGTLCVLDALKNNAPECRFYNAATSELYGLIQEMPQNEDTPFYPRSPYAAAKLYSYWITINYREAYDLFACSGILFNHESERRTPNFVTRKISLAAARIAQGKQEVLVLGNLAAKRDWGYAPEFTEGMQRILDHDKPEEFVLATGETHTVEEFCHAAFNTVGLPLEFEGEGLCRVGRDKEGKVRIRVSPHYFRPTEVDVLCGDASKAKCELGWEPRVKFSELAEIMTKHDLDLVKKGYDTNEL